jgi:hypothetical protein
MYTKVLVSFVKTISCMTKLWYERSMNCTAKIFLRSKSRTAECQYWCLCCHGGLKNRYGFRNIWAWKSFSYDWLSVKSVKKWFKFKFWIWEFKIGTLVGIIGLLIGTAGKPVLKPEIGKPVDVQLFRKDCKLKFFDFFWHYWFYFCAAYIYDMTTIRMATKQKKTYIWSTIRPTSK